MAFTFFFRDSETLELAIEEALPSLQGRAFIHVWDAGCAHGPEPYTLAILLRERMSDYHLRQRPHPCHRHRCELRRPRSPRASFAEKRGQARPGRDLPEVLPVGFQARLRRGRAGAAGQGRVFAPRPAVAAAHSGRTQPDRLQERAAALRRSRSESTCSGCSTRPFSLAEPRHGAHSEIARDAGDLLPASRPVRPGFSQAGSGGWGASGGEHRVPPALRTAARAFTATGRSLTVISRTAAEPTAGRAT